MIILKMSFPLFGYNDNFIPLALRCRLLFLYFLSFLFFLFYLRGGRVSFVHAYAVLSKGNENDLSRNSLFVLAKYRRTFAEILERYFAEMLAILAQEFKLMNHIG